MEAGTENIIYVEIHNKNYPSPEIVLVELGKILGLSEENSTVHRVEVDISEKIKNRVCGGRGQVSE